MINALAIFRHLSDFYSENLESTNPLIQHFCLVYSRLIGGSPDVESINYAVVEDFERFAAEFDNIEDDCQDDLDALDKTLKKACKKFGIKKTFEHLDTLNYLAGMLDLLKETPLK